MGLTQEEFSELRDMVFSESGIFLKPEKMYLMETRLQARLQVLNCVNTSEYIQFLKYDRSKAELEQLIDSLTTNETFFFRDDRQLATFSDEVLPEIIEKKRKSNDMKIRIWSAGCSTGEEPYTLSMLLMEKIRDITLWNIQILATDISQRVLAACRAGVYPPRSLKDTPDYYTNKYFTKIEHMYKINFAVKKLVQFSQMNLSNRGMMRSMANIDCILCRNVLIYFNDISAKKVINSFYDSLNPGGAIFLGHSESMHRLSAAFRMVKYKNSFVYKKEV